MADPLIAKIKALVLKQAEDNRNSAGYGGSMTDGGASLLEAQVRFYDYGARGVIPPEWEQHAKEAKAQADPEYAEYLRLAAKFK